MRNVVSRFSLTQQMIFMAAVFVAGLSVCIAVSVGVIAKVKVTGPTYQEIIQGKDLVADILPPPEYIIESYLLALQAAREDDGVKRNELLTRFRQLRKEYDERHAYWVKALPNDKTREIMLVESYQPAVAFYDTALRDYFPALQRGDIKTADRILSGQLRPAYEAHRKAIDKVVQLTNRKNAAIEESTAALLKNSRLLLAVIVLAVFAVCGIVITIIMRNLAGSFSFCAEIIDRVAAGDLSVEVPVSGRGTIRRMLVSLDLMIGNLRAIILDVRTASGKIEDSADRLSASSCQMSGASDEVTMQVGTVATAGEEMAATSCEIAGNCGMAAEGARQAHDLAQNGTEVVRETISRMQQIARRVTDSAATVENLGSRSDQIGAIVGTIEDIADQTNLLALNAAIEAARAGEQGRGFAVVADEVRALAERTTKATKEIGAMIKTIQDETRNAVASMKEGVREVELGTGEARRSGEALNEILDQIDAVAIQVSQIATAAEQQNATTSEISGNMQRISNLVEDSLQGTRETADAASQLARLADDLQQAVGRFSLAV